MPVSTDDRTQDDLCFRPATEIAAQIRAKRLSPVEIVDAVLRRIEALNPRLNAFCFLHADEARGAARAAEAAVVRGEALGPLHGVPISIKDNVPVEGKPMTSGSRLMRDHIARESSPLASRVA